MCQFGEYMPAINEHILVGCDHLGTKPKWERYVIALACAHTLHIKNKCVVCCRPKTLNDMLSHLFLVHSIHTLLFTFFTIALIKSSLSLYSTFHSFFFFHKITFSFSCTCYLLNTIKHS